MSKIKTLVVDDEPNLLDLTRIFLERHNDISVSLACSAKEALAMINTEDFDVVVSDYQMPVMDGLQLLKSLKEIKRDLPFILFTGKGRESVAVDALNLGASFYLQKGGDPESQFTELANMIRRSEESFRARIQLSDSENRFRNLVQNSSDFITIIDRNGIVVYSSSSIKKILGYDEEYLVGKSPLEIIHPDDHGKVRSELALVMLNQHDGLPAEFQVRKLDGEYIPVESVGRNMFGVPSVDGMVITTRPIIERKKAETALRESEALYHSLFDKSPLSIALNDLEGRFVDVNEKHLEMTGLTKADIMGKTPVDLGYVDKKGFEDMTGLLRKNGGYLDQHPTVVRQPNGKYVHLLTSARFITFKGEDHVLTMSDDVTDLTETKKDLQIKNEELDRERAKLQMITDMAPNIVYQLRVNPDYSMEFQFVSKAAENILHVPLQLWYDNIDQIIDQLFEEDRDSIMDSVFDAMVSHDLWQKEFRIIDTDGSMKWILGTATPSLALEDSSVVWTGTFSDVTERRKSDEVLRQMNRQLNLMTSITRHDCLNKIAVALGYLELAAQQVHDQGVNNLIDKAVTSVGAIRSEIELTRDLQDLSGQTPVWQNLQDIVQRSGSIHNVHISDNCHRMEIYANPMLEKVFHNLIDNSVRHGGHVQNIWLDCDPDEKGLTLIYRDDGIGIPTEDKVRIFFRGYGKNTGLGLFLIQEVLNMTHITIIENGLPGKGARFEIRVPLGDFRYVR